MATLGVKGLVNLIAMCTRRWWPGLAVTRWSRST